MLPAPTTITSAGLLILLLRALRTPVVRSVDGYLFADQGIAETRGYRWRQFMHPLRTETGGNDRGESPVVSVVQKLKELFFCPGTGSVRPKIIEDKQVCVPDAVE